MRDGRKMRSYHEIRHAAHLLAQCVHPEVDGKMHGQAALALLALDWVLFGEEGSERFLAVVEGLPRPVWGDDGADTRGGDD